MTGNYRTKILRTVGVALIAIGALIILQIVYTDIYTSLSQRGLHERWDKATVTGVPNGNNDTSQTVESTITASTVDTSPVDNSTSVSPDKQRVSIPKKKPFAKIVIPKIGLDAIVVEGVSDEALKLGPGHMEETAHPGEIGNMVVSGHRVTYSRPFYYLDRLEKGDPIHIHTTSQEFTYYVHDKKVVKPTDVSVIQPTSDRTLTLTTCNPRFSAKTRLIIIAKMKDDK